MRQRSNAKGRAAGRVVLGIAGSGRYTKEDFKILINRLILIVAMHG